MTLKEIRERFVQESGRLDLVNDDGSDNGADFYINNGQRHLDRLTQFRKAGAVNYQILRPNDYLFYVKDCRAVHSVSYIAHSDYQNPYSTHERSWRTLPPWTIEQARAAFPHSFTRMLEYRDKPIMYCLFDVRGTQDTMRANDFQFFESMSDLAGLVMAQYYDKVGILLLPITRNAIQVEVRGLFYCPKLINDDDTSYWTTEEPGLLLQAALREMEVFHRNTQGVKDWDRAIDASTVLLEQDFIYEEAYHTCQMEG